MIYRYVRACSWSQLKVALEDRRAGFGVDLLESHRFAAAMTQYDLAVRRTDVGHPVDALAEHRDQIPLSSIVGYDNGKRADLPRFPAPHLQRVLG